MPRLVELKNEWAEAVAKAKELAAGNDQAAFDRAWEAAENARNAFERLEKVEEAEKSVDAKAVDYRDIRNPEDASDVKPVTADTANAAKNNYIEVSTGVYLPFATRNAEGFIRNNPVSVQLPSVMARYEPGGELWTQAQLQRKAFAAWMRGGENAVKKRDDLDGHNGNLWRALNALQEGDDTEGGYLVPTDERMELIHDPGVPGGVTRPISRVLTTSRDAGTFPTATTVTWGAIAEEATPSDSDPAFSQVPFTIRKSGVNMLLSEELLADSAVNLPAYIGRIVTETSGRYEDQQAVEGDGSNEPLGLRTTGAPQGNISDQTIATTLTFANVVNAYFALPAQYRGQGAAWHTTSSFMAQCVALSATGGQLWLLPNGEDRPGFRMLGLPVAMYDGTGWDDAATIGSTEEVGAIGNFQQYWFVDRLGVSIRRDDSVNFKSDQIAFKARKRYDSFFAENNAFRILKAS